MDTDVKAKLELLFEGPLEESLSGHVGFDNDSFIVFEHVKRERLLYIKEYITVMRVTSIEIQEHDGGPEDLQ